MIVEMFHTYGREKIMPRDPIGGLNLPHPGLMESGCIMSPLVLQVHSAAPHQLQLQDRLHRARLRY